MATSPPPSPTTTTLSQLVVYSSELEVSQAVLYSTLLVAVILGGMRTTRRTTLQVLGASPWLGAKLLRHVLASSRRPLLSGLRRALPPGARRRVKAVVRAAIRLVLGRYALKLKRATAASAKGEGGSGSGSGRGSGSGGIGRANSSLKRSHRKGHRNLHVNWTITLYRRMPLRAMSRLWGRFNQLELPVFLRKPLLGLYIWLFGCKLEEAEVEDLRRYRNLGEFFRRTLKPHVRPVDDHHVLTSPADGKILYYGEVRDGILEQVKGVTYSLRGFLGPRTGESSHERDADHQQLDHPDQAFQRALSLKPGHELHHCIIYLAPGDYHRFHSPAGWVVDHRRHFPGELLSVNPGIARWVQGLFNFNERAVYTGRWEHGFFSMTAVGATNVGSIKIYCDQELETNVHGKQPDHTYFDKKFADPVTVSKGDMFGEFNLGSTIVLIFEAPKGFKFKISEGQKIKFGRPIGTIP